MIIMIIMMIMIMMIKIVKKTTDKDSQQKATNSSNCERILAKETTTQGFLPEQFTKTEAANSDGDSDGDRDRSSGGK